MKDQISMLKDELELLLIRRNEVKDAQAVEALTKEADEILVENGNADLVDSSLSVA